MPRRPQRLRLAEASSWRRLREGGAWFEKGVHDGQPTVAPPAPLGFRPSGSSASGLRSRWRAPPPPWETTAPRPGLGTNGSGCARRLHLPAAAARQTRIFTVLTSGTLREEKAPGQQLDRRPSVADDLSSSPGAKHPLRATGRTDPVRFRQPAGTPNVSSPIGRSICSDRQRRVRREDNALVLKFLPAYCLIVFRSSCSASSRRSPSRRRPLSVPGRPYVRFLGRDLRRHAVEPAGRRAFRTAAQYARVRRLRDRRAVDQHEGPRRHEHVVLRRQPARVAHDLERRRSNQSNDFEGSYRDGAMRFKGWVLDKGGKRMLVSNVLENVSPERAPHLLDVGGQRQDLGRPE